LLLAGVAGLVFSLGCGEKEPPPGSHWTAKYRAFGGNKPAIEVDRNWQEFMDRPVLGEVSIAAPSVMTALTELNSVVKEAGGQIELQVAILEPDHENYRTAINLKMNNPTIADAIDEIAREAKGLVWDFQERQLVIRPGN
jgi:hypothetical protein